MQFVFLTMDGTHSAALQEAAERIAREHGISVRLRHYSATSLRTPADWHAMTRDAANADFIFGARLFGETFVEPLQKALRDNPVPTCIIISNPSLIRLTQVGGFSLRRDEAQPPSMLRQLLGKLRPKSGGSEIKRQMSLLTGVGRLLKHLPGKARDLHTYIAVHQYWTHSSPENLYRMLCLFIERYVPEHQGKLPIQDAIQYPDVALVHPDAPQPFTDLASYQHWQQHRNLARPLDQGRVALLTLRTITLSGNTAHIDALTRGLEARGLEVRTIYTSALDFRPALEAFCFDGNGEHRQSAVDLVINGTGFSLVGGPAESRPEEASAILQALDVPYFDFFPLTMQRVEEWQNDRSGMHPFHLTMNVAIPELDGSTEPLIIGGPSTSSDMFVALDDQITHAVRRVEGRVRLHRVATAERRIGIVVYSFPPSLGNIGSAALLDVFQSIHRLLRALADEGYTVTVPDSAAALETMLREGNASLYGTDGNVAAHLPVDSYRRLFPHYRDIEESWGAAPGDMLTDGKQFHILGVDLGNVFIGIQPPFGYERDPMRLLMAEDATPSHAFAAFYTWLEHSYRADAVLHFGTHGALEFMPGKQSGMSTDCWPTRLLGSLPNIYYYSVNNPSEGTIARRRSAATIVSYLVPPLQQAGLYKELRLLKDSLDRYRAMPDHMLLEDICMQGERIGLASVRSLCEPGSTDTTLPAASDDLPDLAPLAHELLQVEQRLIPVGLHILDTPPTKGELVDMLTLVATFARPVPDQLPLPQVLAAVLGYDYVTLSRAIEQQQQAQDQWQHLDHLSHEAIRLLLCDDNHAAAADAYVQHETGLAEGTLSKTWAFLSNLHEQITHDHELAGLQRALRGGYIPPSPGSDIVRNPAVVPTGRNIYGLDPHSMPSGNAQEQGAILAGEMLERLTHDNGALPETVAVVLWGIDNLKSGGEGIAQVLALLGARMVPDELGKATGVELIPLAELGRPRVDVVVTVSGIFRDLLHHQMVLLDRAVQLAATADEPTSANFIRKHAQQQAHDMDISVEEAAVRVFANAPGSYGSHVNQLVESSSWDSDDQLSEAFLSRKSYSFKADCAGGEWRNSRAIMERALSTVDATFQNIDSFEVGISDIDYYYESLGGVTKSVERLRGQRPPVMVADAVASTGRLSTLEQMVRLETRAKLLNPKWFEAMLTHGSSGVREIEARVQNTYGWSVTTQAVEGWAYQGVADTFLLDSAMRERLTELNPHAVNGMTRRLLEAHARGYWDANEDTINALHAVYEDLEEQLEGVGV